LSGCVTGRPVVIPSDRQILKLEDGNYKVSPAWLQDFYRYLRTLEEQLKDCKADRK